MKKIVVFLVSLFMLASFTDTIEAKILPRFRSASRKSGRVVYSGIVVSPRLRPDRNALIIYFANLQKANNVFYTLIYQTEGKDEGVSGMVDASAGNNTSREILFGTCSAGVCRYHHNITNMRLEVVSELSSGKRSIKRYRIKV